MLNFVKKFSFKNFMKGVRENLALAYRCLELSDRCEYKGDQENSDRLFNESSAYLLKAHKDLCFAASSVPKNDPLAVYQIAEIILKLDNPIKYYSNYYGLDFMYKFKTKTIEAKWNEQSQMFVNNSKDLIDYENALKKMSVK